MTGGQVHVRKPSARRTALRVLALAGITLLSGCGRGGGLAADTAARVGAERVSRAAVLGPVERALAGKTSLKRAPLARQHLTTQVKLALYRQEASKLGVTLTGDERAATTTAFEERTQQQGGLEKAAQTAGIAKEDIPDIIELVTYEQVLALRLVKDAPVTDAELDQLRKTNPKAFPDQAHAAHILVNDEATANKVLAEAKAGGDFAALAAKYSTDPGSKDKGGDLGTTPRGTFVPPFEAALYAAKAGDIVGPVKTEFGYHVIKVIEIKPFADVKEQARAASAAEVGRTRLMDEVKKGLPVTINPRFGRWDAANLVVLGPDAGQDEPSTPSAAPGALPGQ